MNSYQYVIPKSNIQSNKKKYIYNLDCKKVFPCNYCDKHFKQSGHLSTHIKLKHNHEKMHFCEFPNCTKKFPVKWALRTHMKIHSSKKEFTCHLCDKSFHQKVNLKSHINLNHEKIKYNCNECEKCFNNKYLLKYHVNNVHVK